MTLHVTTAGPPIRALTMEPEVLRQFISATFPTPGVVGANDLLVGAPGGMFVSVAAGFGVVAGADVVPTQGSYIAFNDASVNVAVSASNGTNPRIDLVILTIQDAFYQGAVNAPSFQVIAGTPAGSPVAPAIPVAYRDYIPLAQILVPAASGSVIIGNITDTRVRAAQRVTPVAGKVDTLESTASAAYTDLTTVGPAVTLVTGTSALVILSAFMGHSAQFNVNLMTVAVSGASTIAAIDGNSISYKEPDTSPGSASMSVAGTSVITGLTPGINTFTAKYRTGAATANYATRRIAVIPL